MTTKIGPVIKVDGYKEYTTEMNNIIKQAKELKSEMGLLESTFNKEGKTLQQNREQRNLLTQQIENQSKKLETQREHLAKAEEALRKEGLSEDEVKAKTQALTTEINNTETALNKMKSQLQSLPNDLEYVGQKMQSTGDKISNAGQKMSSIGQSITRLTAPLTALGVASIKSGAEFDAGMSNVQAVMNTTQEGLEELRDTALKWGESTKYTATEVSDALYYMGLAGWSSEEAIASIGGVLNLASAGNLDLARTSDIVTDAMTAMGYSASEVVNGISNAEHFANVLAGTMSNTNTTVDLLGESFKYVAPVAGTLGYNIEDLATALGLMANNGIKGSTAGTTLRNILTNMSKPTDEMSQAMEALGVSLDDGQGNMLSFYEVMKELRSGFGDLRSSLVAGDDGLLDSIAELDNALEEGSLSEEEYEQALDSLIGTTLGAEQAEKARYASMLAGKRGMSGLLAIVNATDEEFEGLVDTLYGVDEAFDGVGYATGMAETQLDNLKGDWTKLTSAFGTSKIVISDIANGALRNLVQKLTDLVVKFNNLDPVMQKQIVKWGAIAVASGPVLAIGGELVTMFGDLTKKLGTGVEKIGTFTKALSSGQGVMGAFTSIGLNPMALAIGATVTAIGALVVATKRAMDMHTQEMQALWGVTEAQQENIDAIKARKEAIEDMNAQTQANVDATTSEYDRIEALKDEYNQLITANGEVVKGGEERANFIKSELANALGIEISQIEELIEENGKLGASIDTLIQKQKMQAMQKAYEDEYVEAVKQSSSALRELTEAQSIQADAQTRYEEATALVIEKQAQFKKEMEETGWATVETANAYSDALEAQDIAKDSLDKATKSVYDAQTAYNDYANTIQNYEGVSAKILAEDYEGAERALSGLSNDLKHYGVVNGDELGQQYIKWEGYYLDLLSEVQSGSGKVTDAQLKEAKNMRDMALAEFMQFDEQTGKSLDSAFNNQVKSIQEGGAKTEAKLKTQGSKGTKAYDNGLKENLDGISRTSEDMANRVKKPSNIYNELYSNGAYSTQGWINGMNSKAGALAQTASGLANMALSRMKNTLGIASPSKEFMKLGEYSGEGYAIGLANELDEVSKMGLQFATSSLQGFSGGSTMTKSISAPISVNVNVNGSVDNAQDLATTIANEINNQIIRKEAVFNG